jgi:ammonium transporter, Amt family
VTADLVCFWACTWLKHRFRYDDSLDVFGVHGVGGLVGTLLTGVFATAAIGGVSGLIEGSPRQLLIQLYGVAATLVWSAGMTFVLLKLVSAFVPLRVSREHEMEGLDISQHGEALQYTSTLLPFFCPSRGHNYVDGLSRPHFNQA